MFITRVQHTHDTCLLHFYEVVPIDDFMTTEEHLVTIPTTHAEATMITAQLRSNQLGWDYDQIQMWIAVVAFDYTGHWNSVKQSIPTAQD